MRLRFLGGVNEVGRLGMLLETSDREYLFDYGIAPHDPPKYPEPAPAIEAAFLSHAHLDHSGYMPWAAARYEMPIVGTGVTKTLSELLARDSLKVAKLENYPQPFAPEAIHAMNANFEPVEYGDRRSFKGLDVRFSSAGHIPGSTMFDVTDGSTRLLFTGDVNLIDTRLVERAKPVKTDVLVIEATYAGRQHPDRLETEEAFLDAVDGVVAQGGTVIVPSFAAGRTQEILLLLGEEGYDVHLDGMGKTVTKLMLEESRFCRSASKLSKAFEKAKLVKTPHARERALDADVIVTTSGMMDGGPVQYYIGELKRDPKSAVFVTGFQVPGSVGRRLVDEGVFAPHDGAPEKVALDVRYFDFSAHAGHDEIVEFARACKPEKIVFFHSDKREPLAEALKDDAEVILPVTNQVVEI